MKHGKQPERSIEIEASYGSVIIKARGYTATEVSAIHEKASAIMAQYWRHYDEHAVTYANANREQTIAIHQAHAAARAGA